MGGLFTKQRPLGRLAGRQQPDTRQRHARFTQLCQLRCQKMLIVGERSLPYADSDLVQAQGIPVGIVPHAGHSMAWENPQGLAQLIASHS